MSTVLSPVLFLAILNNLCLLFNSLSIDNKLLKSWVKNKNIQKYIIDDSEYKLIYSNDIKDELDYPIEINEFIGKHKEKLLNRRECKKRRLQCCKRGM